MAIAGYNVDEASKLWVKMAANGSSVPEVLSSHPSDENRIKNIDKYKDEARAYAAAAKK